MASPSLTQSTNNAQRQQSDPNRSLPQTPTEQADDPLATPTNQPVDASTSTPGRSYHVRLVPHLEASSRSLHFEPVNREFKSNGCIRIGRYNDRGPAIGPNDLKSQRVAFKSKVVSRSHAEISADNAGNFWVKDMKSSSGTFLNHIRLSAPGLESRLFQVKDGDVLQLGVDYQGGTEEMYRCVKMKVEFNRPFQKSNNQFNMNAMKQLRALGAVPPATSKAEAGTVAKAAEASTTDCCICLFAVTVCQALFIAPCSHVYHFKCIRPLLNMHHPGFSCPLCRTFADLEADVETEEDHFAEEEARQAEGSDSDPVEEEDVEVEEAQEVVAPPSDETTEDRPATASRRSSTTSRKPRVSNATDSSDPYDTRRASISISGPHGQAPLLLPITGRSSRPSSIRGFDMSNRSLSPMNSTNGLRESQQIASSAFMSHAPTAIDDEDLMRPIDFATTNITMQDESMNDDTLFLSTQTPLNSSLLSRVAAEEERST